MKTLSISVLCFLLFVSGVIAGTNSVSFMWHRPTSYIDGYDLAESNIVGYVLLYRRGIQEYTNGLFTTETNATITGLEDNVYYFTVRALAAPSDGRTNIVESKNSNELRVRVPAPSPSSPTGFKVIGGE